MSRSDSAASSYHHGDLRNALLDAADRMLAERPPAKISLRELAREAGVSHAAPYHYFSDRDGLLKAVGDRAMAGLLEAQQRAHAGADDPLDRIAAVGESYIEFAVGQPHRFALVFDPDLCPPDNPSPERAELITANEDLLRRCIRDIQAAGVQADADPESLAVALWGLVHGIASLVGEGHLPLSAAGPALRAVFTRP